MTGEEYTFSQLLTSSKNAASGLVKLGITKGDVVAVLCPNIPQYAIALLATWACGGVLTTMNPNYTEYELTYYLKDSGASFVVTMQELVPKVRKACQEYHRLKKIITCTVEPTAGCVAFSELTNDDGSMYPHDTQIQPKKDLALLLYSSGTTGLPKGVMLTHFNLVASWSQYGHNDIETLHKDDVRRQVTMGILPFFHTAGILGHLIGCVGDGGRLICMRQFESHSFLGAIEKYKVLLNISSIMPTDGIWEFTFNAMPGNIKEYCTVYLQITNLTLVPPLIVFMNKSELPAHYDLSSIKYSEVGAGQVKADQIEEYKRKLGLDSLPNSNI